MPSRVLRPALLAAAVLSLAGCGGGGDDRRDDADAGLNVTTTTTATTNTVETAPAVAPAPVIADTETRPAAPRNVRDGPGEERGPEYEGARSAATALPSQGDDTNTDATPPPPSTPPGAPQNAVSGR